jgi:uncharacterized protein (TIGR02246 family)
MATTTATPQHTSPHTSQDTPPHAAAEPIAAAVLALERGAMDRWNRGDVEGCLELYADDVSYFDPITATRLDGLPAVAAYFRSVWAGKVRIARYEIVNPQVVTDGTLAVLTYNLVNYVHAADGSETAGTPWNSTQVYRRTGDRWRVGHVHWSFTRHPAFASMSPEDAEGLTT